MTPMMQRSERRQELNTRRGCTRSFGVISIGGTRSWLSTPMPYQSSDTWQGSSLGQQKRSKSWTLRTGSWWPYTEDFTLSPVPVDCMPAGRKEADAFRVSMDPSGMKRLSWSPTARSGQKYIQSLMRACATGRRCKWSRLKIGGQRSFMVSTTGRLKRWLIWKCHTVGWEHQVSMTIPRHW